MPVIRGEKKSCFAQTEADAGSDPAAMRTTAVRDGDYSSSTVWTVHYGRG
jgi:acyl-CoA dehydrogenase